MCNGAVILHSTIRIATFNIHKGHTGLSSRFALHEQRELLHRIQPDIVFLQEVRDEHKKNRLNKSRSVDRQSEFLAGVAWPSFAYGKNAVYPAGHHGNAILSKFPISKIFNKDISSHAVEQRGMLHCEIDIPGWDQPLHGICVHLGLFSHWRLRQLQTVRDYIEENIPHNAKLIIAGDFNDWGLHAGKSFASSLHLREVFEQAEGKPARSFPSWMPVLRLDRIYVRGFNIRHVQVHGGPLFDNLSDHAILSATIAKAW